MNASDESRRVEVLLVEDNLSDIQLTMEALNDANFWTNLNVVRDGEEAMEYLRQTGRYAGAPRPHLVLLDLNLPKKNGREVLGEMKQDPDLKRIPVLILTTSQASADILETYNLHANCYLVKPSGLEEFSNVVRSIEDFWMKTVTLPTS